MINFSFNAVNKREEYFLHLETSDKDSFPSLDNLVVLRGKEINTLLYDGHATEENIWIFLIVNVHNLLFV